MLFKKIKVVFLCLPKDNAKLKDARNFRASFLLLFKTKVIKLCFFIFK